MTYKSYVLLLFAVIPFTAYAGWFEPSDYDDCILKSMKGVTSDVAARQIMRSCGQKFPPIIDGNPSIQ